MKVVVFTEVHQGRIQGWLDSVGDIYITGTAMDNGRLILFYVDRKERRAAAGSSPASLPEGAHREVHCPKCNALMKVKSNGVSGDLFWGCTKYPVCKGTRKLLDEDWIALSGHPGPGSGAGGGDDEDIPF